MNTSTRFAIFAILTTIITACGAPAATPNATSVETIVATTLQAYTQAAPTSEPTTTPIPTEIDLQMDGLSFKLPYSVANSAITEIKPVAPPADDMPWWGIHPEYKVYYLEDYKLTGTFHEPRIFKFPVAEYESMNEDAGKRIQVLKSILNNPASPFPDKLPFLPTWNAGEVFHSNVQAITFQNGTGIRYLTEYGQFPAPVSNSGLIYTFQGLTSDGAYYISAVLPINISFLPAQASPDSPIPPDGIPFNWEDYTQNDEHYRIAAERLNTADPNTFQPTLPTLDALIQSILSQ